MKIIIIITTLFFISNTHLSSQDWFEPFVEKNNANFNEIVNSANKHFDTVDTKQKGSGIKQYKRFEWFWNDRVLPDGSFPNLELLTKSIFHKNNLKLNSTQSTNEWRHLGPFGSNGGYSGIGRVNCVRVNPHNDEIWVGTPSGGIWISTNDGNSWKTITDNENIITSLGITSIAFHPTNSDIVYAATGDGDGTNTYSYGVIKTTDGGDSWKATGLKWNITQYRTISKLLIDNSAPNTLYIAGSSGIYKSTNSGDNWNLVKSGNFKDMEFKPNEYNTLYASGTELWKSSDNGNNWNKLTNGIPSSGVRRIAIAVSKNSPNALYALFGNSPGNNLKGVYLSTNSGANFKEIADGTPNMMGYSKTGDDTKGQVWYDLCIEADQDDWKKVIIGGVNLWRTTNAGQNWEISSMWYGNHNNLTTVHADQHDLWYDDDNNKMYVGNDGSVYSSDDFGKSWDWIGSGILATQFYRFGISQLDSSLYIGGTQDNGTKVKREDGKWVDKIGGDGFDALIDHSDKSIMYASLYYGDYFKSTNGGGSFKRINDIDDDNEYDDITEGGGWSTPLILNPKNNNTVLIGMNNLWISNDGSETFSKISNFNYGNNKIVRIAMSEVDTNIIYVSFNSRLYKTTNYGSDWSQVTRPGNTRLSYIYLDADDSNKLWATNSRYSSNNKVFESTDAGNTWTNISLNLPNIPVLTIVKQKGTDDRLWIGTDVGVYYKDDNMNEWLEYNENLPNVIITELEINSKYNQLFASTYGRGIWKVDIPTSLNSPLISSPNLDAYGVKTNNLLIDWNDVEDADDYIVELSLDSNFNDIVVTDTVNISRYVASNLENNEKYFTRLKSTNQYTQSDWSSSHYFTTVVGRVQLLLPSNNSKSISFNSDLTWKAQDGATGYELIVSDNEDFTTIVKNINTSDLDSKLNQDLTIPLEYNKMYWWKVRASNNGVEEPDWSIYRNFESFLNKPNIILPEDNSEDLENSFVASWTSVSGADMYEIVYFEIKNSSELFTDTTDNTSIVLQNLKSFTKYGIYLYAMKNGNKGLVSDTNSFTTSIGKLSLISPSNDEINSDLSQNFKWSTLDYSTKYKIEIDTNINFNSSELIENELNQANINIMLNNYNKLYYWRVSAFVNEKKGPNSEISIFRTKLAPTNLIYPSDNESNIRLDTILSWESYDNSDYQLQISSDEYFNNIVTDEIYSENVAPITTLKNYTNYFWRVKRIKDNYESDWSEVFKFKTDLGKPTLILPKDSIINQDIELSLVWNKISFAQKYELQIDTNVSFNSPLLEVINSNNNTEKIINLLNDMNYYWRVRLIVDNEESIWSDINMFRTKLMAPSLTNPLDGEIEISNKGLLKWTNNSSASRSNVLLSGVRSFNSVIYDEYVNNNEFSFSGLDNDKQYYWKVKSVRNSNESDWSEVYSFYTTSTIDRPLLIEPQNLAKNVDVNNNLSLFWNKLNNIQSYEIQIANDTMFTDIIFENGSIKDNKYSFEPTFNSHIYFWKVRGIRENDTSDWSEIWSFSTKLPQVNLVSPSNNSIQSKTVKLEWLKDENAQSYNIELSEDISFENILEKFVKNTDANTFLLENLENDKQYYWRVNSENSIANSDWSEIWNFETNKTETKILFKDTKTSFEIVPNPVDDMAMININSEISVYLNLRLTDLNGQNMIQLFNSKINRNEKLAVPLSSEGLTSGVYLLILETMNESKTIKVIIN